MKKIYTLVLFIISFFSGNAQIVNIPDENFKAKLLEASANNQIASIQTPTTTGFVTTYNSIDTNGDGEIQVSEAQSIKWLRVSISNISNLSGIEAFINLEYLDCRFNQITNLDISFNTNLINLNCIQNQLSVLDVTQNINLSILHCFQNQLSSLDVTHNVNLTELFCYENPLNTLNVSQNLNLSLLYCYSNLLSTIDVSQNINLTKLYCNGNLLTNINVTQNPNLQHLVCNNNQISSLDVSQNVNLTYLNCSQNLITTLDLTENNNLTQIVCKQNQLSTINVSQNPNLNWFDCSFNQLTILDVIQFENLYELSCRDNQLTTIDVTQNSFLTRLVCNNNLLLTLFIKNNNQQNWLTLDFSNNSNLQYICADEGDIPLVQQRITTYGYTNCHVNSYCSFVPNGTFYTIQGNSKFDSNADGCDASDVIMPNQKYTFISGALSGSLIPDESGDYAYDVQSGTHVITPVLEYPSYFIISPTSASVTFPSTTSPFIQDFCLTASGIKNDLEITIIPIQVARPGFDAEYKVIYKNKGNQIGNGTLSFSFDDTVMDLVSSIPTVDGSGTNSLNWNFTNLNPFETREINVIFNINSPMETPAVNDGDILVYTATIVGTTDETPNDNTFTLNQTVVNSYDPNDKTCLEGNTISPEMVGEYVHYVIRFENTGTFAAENVVITDVIDTSKFKLNTLIPLSSSHNFFTRINGNKVEFIFENINLPFDDENNDGYVAFKIKTKPNLVLGDEFTNTASIYFDYNFPIITNTTSTTVTALSDQDFDFETNFTLYPNPAKDVLNIKVKSEIEIKSASIYNTLGQIIMTTIHAENGEINVSNLQSGSYFIKVFTEKGSSTSKFIKK